MNKRKNHLEIKELFIYKRPASASIPSVLALTCTLISTSALAYYDGDSGPWSFYPIFNAVANVNVNPGTTGRSVF